MSWSRATQIAAAASLLLGGATTIAAITTASAATPTVHVWATDVNVRFGTSSTANQCNTNPSTSLCSVIETVAQPGKYGYVCQQSGQSITYDGHSSNWWTFIKVNGTAGWVSNVFITGAAHLAGVVDCTK